MISGWAAAAALNPWAGGGYARQLYRAGFACQAYQPLLWL